MQNTLAARFSLQGVGLHSGRSVRCEVQPGDVDTGFVFLRTDLSNAPEIPGRWPFVKASPLATTLECEGVSVSTVEHLLSALYGLGVDNARILLDCEEVPVLDGSAEPWCEAIESVGRVEQNRPAHRLGESVPIQIKDGARRLEWQPGDGLQVNVEVAFPHVGQEALGLTVTPENFRKELAWARTFGFEDQLEALRAQGLAKGGSLDNALVFGGQGVLNPGGLRGEREVVRHKILDLIGDLALSGLRMSGRLTVERPGHAFTHRFLAKLLGREADSAA